jgi:hemerythrin-like domain-containing protein
VDAKPLWRQLRAEHREMGHLTQALLHGHAAGRVHDLVRHGARARRLLNLVRQHIDVEEHVLLPLIQGQPLPSRSHETGDGYLMLPVPCMADSRPEA